MVLLLVHVVLRGVEAPRASVLGWSWVLGWIWIQLRGLLVLPRLLLTCVPGWWYAVRVRPTVRDKCGARVSSAGPSIWDLDSTFLTLAPEQRLVDLVALLLIDDPGIERVGHAPAHVQTRPMMPRGGPGRRAAKRGAGCVHAPDVRRDLGAISARTTPTT